MGNSGWFSGSVIGCTLVVRSPRLIFLGQRHLLSLYQYKYIDNKTGLRKICIVWVTLVEIGPGSEASAGKYKHEIIEFLLNHGRRGLGG